MIVRTREPQTDDQPQPYGLDLRDRSFGISHLQILDESGKLDAEREPDLSTEQLIRLYRAMVLARAVDDRLLKMQRQGRIGTFQPV